MKYFSAIITLSLLNIVTIISLLYFANATRHMQKENALLKNNINFIKEQININEIEYSLYSSYEYLKKLQGIYFNINDNAHSTKRINFNFIKNKNIKDYHTIGIH